MKKLKISKKGYITLSYENLRPILYWAAIEIRNYKGGYKENSVADIINKISKEIHFSPNLLFLELILKKASKLI